MAMEQYTEGEEELLVVIKWLTDEFGLEVDPRTIHRVAMEEWALFDRAKVRLYVCPIPGGSPACVSSSISRA